MAYRWVRLTRPAKERPSRKRMLLLFRSLKMDKCMNSIRLAASILHNNKQQKNLRITLRMVAVVRISQPPCAASTVKSQTNTHRNVTPREIPSGTDWNFGLAKKQWAVLSPHRHPWGHWAIEVRNSAREKNSMINRNCNITDNCTAHTSTSEQICLFFIREARYCVGDRFSTHVRAAGQQSWLLIA